MPSPLSVTDNITYSPGLMNVCSLSCALSRVRPHMSRIGGQLGFEFHVFADQGPQQPLHVSHDRIQIHNLQFQQLFAAECQ